MLLIAEIILTIFAWRKGWKWYSLIPVLSAIIIAIIFALSGGVNVGGMVIFDVLAVIALAIMCSKGPKKATESEQVTS
jgi:hypothetical protein